MVCSGSLSDPYRPSSRLSVPYLTLDQARPDASPVSVTSALMEEAVRRSLGEPPIAAEVAHAERMIERMRAWAQEIPQERQAQLSCGLRRLLGPVATASLSTCLRLGHGSVVPLLP